MTFQEDRGRDEGTYSFIGRVDGEVTLRSFYYSFVKSFNESYIRLLKDFFTNNPRAYCFRNEDGTLKVHIAEAFGTEPEKYPAVIVERTECNIEDLFLAQKLGRLVVKQSDIYIPIGERLGGKARLSCSLKIAAFETTARDALSDLILYSLVGPLHWSMTKEGFNRLPNSVQAGAEGVENSEKFGQILHTRSLAAGFDSEWYDDFFYNSVDISEIEFFLERSS